MESIFQEKSLVRFMLLVKANKDVEAGKLPTEQILADLAKFNDELLKAGALIEITGLQPSSKGARLHFSGGKCAVTDGPFAETRELIGGYWIIKANSLGQA